MQVLSIKYQPSISNINLYAGIKYQVSTINIKHQPLCKYQASSINHQYQTSTFMQVLKSLFKEG